MLIIEHDPASSGPGSLPLFNGRACYERRAWESFSPKVLLDSTARLILAHSISCAEKAVLFFHWLRENPIPVPILATLPESADQELLRAASAVTDDFVFWPLREEELRLRLDRLLKPHVGAQDQVPNALRVEMGLGQLVGEHPSFLRAVEHVPLFGASEAPVLISGETGTGKELFAHAIHALSRRRSGPFIPVDCGTLPEHLAENELFGHRRGAFTDAYTDQKGLASMAEGGTLFLDEVDALSPANQSKLLRFLQEGTYRALGADHFSRANTRIIAATNGNLEDCVDQRLFRKDLYFRLNVLRLHLSSLRDRRSDIPLLAVYFLENECTSQKCERKRFSTCALRKLESYDWPGNVRELFNVVQRAFVHCPGRQILPGHIWLSHETGSLGEDAFGQEDFQSAKHHVIERFERTYIQALLVRHQGNVTHAAREAGKERRALGRLIKKYGIGVQSAHSE